MKAEASTIEQQLKKAYQEVEKETGQSKAITSITAANVVAYPVQSNLQSLSARDLINMDLPPTEFLVNGLLPIGVGILAAPSKMGKSWLCLDLGMCIAQGEPFFGYTTKKGDVLYLALEDSLNRIRSRLNLIPQGQNPPHGFRFATNSEGLDRGLIGQIQKYMQEYPATRLVIIDTLQMVKPNRGRKDPYESDYEIMKLFHGLSRCFNLAILLIHHTRKRNGIEADPFESILGSTALQGATDFMYVIEKEQIKSQYCTLYGRGRDFNDVELRIQFDTNTCTWINLGDADELERFRAEQAYTSSPIVQTIIAKLDQLDRDNPEADADKEYVVTANQLKADILKETGKSIRGNVGTELAKLEYYLRKKDGIVYEAPGNRASRYNSQTGRYHKFYKQNKI